jgi:predicted nucleic acid-binding protein
MERSTKVLDSWAIMAFFEGEPAANSVEAILNESIQARSKLLMTSVNLGEVWYSIARAQGAQAADKAIQSIQSLNVEIVPADWELSLQAAIFKSKTPVAYADCFAAALAYLHNTELVTGDREFEKFQNQIRILWIA